PLSRFSGSASPSCRRPARPRQWMRGRRPSHGHAFRTREGTQMIRDVLLRGFAGIALLAGALAAAGEATAQTAPDTGTVTGRVVLAVDGSPVHGATVVVVGTRRSATTDETGGFRIDSVPAGTHEVIAQREHLSADRQTVTVTAGETVEIAFALGLEARHESIAVTASAVGISTTF